MAVHTRRRDHRALLQQLRAVNALGVVPRGPGVRLGAHLVREDGVVVAASAGVRESPLVDQGPRVLGREHVVRSVAVLATRRAVLAGQARFPVDALVVHRLGLFVAASALHHALVRLLGRSTLTGRVAVCAIQLGVHRLFQAFQGYVVLPVHLGHDARLALGRGSPFSRAPAAGRDHGQEHQGPFTRAGTKCLCHGGPRYLVRTARRRSPSASRALPDARASSLLRSCRRWP